MKLYIFLFAVFCMAAFVLPTEAKKKKSGDTAVSGGCSESGGTKILLEIDIQGCNSQCSKDKKKKKKGGNAEDTD